MPSDSLRLRTLPTDAACSPATASPDRSWIRAALRRLGRWAAICLLGLAAQQVALAQTLGITPITWHVIGLDSNNVNVGPDTFPVGARVCNTGSQSALNVRATLSLGAGAAPISVFGASTLNNGTVTAAPPPVPSPYTISTTPTNCTDFYFYVRIDRTAPTIYNTTKQFVITAVADNATAVSTPSPREIFVEKLVSQNRNQVVQISGPSTVYVGDTYTYTFATATATGGYEQIENFIFWPNPVFQILSVSTSYSQPAGGINSTSYGDACGWDNNPASATYRSCIGPVNYTGGKAGGSTITTQYRVKILAPATTGLTGVVHDFSGSSYHYNSDYGALPISIESKYRTADLVITKSDGQTTVAAGATTTYTVVVSNAGPLTATDSLIRDPAVTGLTKTSLACVASAGVSCPVTLTVAALEGSGLLVPSLPVGGNLTLTVAAQVSGTATGTITNLATVLPGPNVVDSNLANNTATDANAVVVSTILSVTKTNGTDTVVSGATTSYTLVVANSGAHAANGTVVRDAPGTGLSCAAATCTATTGGATCPANLPLGTPVAAGATTLFGTGEALPLLPAGSTVTLQVDCLVTASGT